MCPSSARRIYHRVRWVHSASSLPTQQQGIELLFSSQLRNISGYSTCLACLRYKLRVESLHYRKSFPVCGGAQQDAARETGEDVDPETRDCRPDVSPDDALSGPGPGDVSVVDQSRVTG